MHQSTCSAFHILLVNSCLVVLQLLLSIFLKLKKQSLGWLDLLLASFADESHCMLHTCGQLILDQVSGSKDWAFIQSVVSANKVLKIMFNLPVDQTWFTHCNLGMQMLTNGLNVFSDRLLCMVLRNIDYFVLEVLHTLVSRRAKLTAGYIGLIDASVTCTINFIH